MYSGSVWQKQSGFFQVFCPAVPPRPSIRPSCNPPSHHLLLYFHRVDLSLCADGYRCRPNPPGTGFRPAQPQHKSVHCSADRQFLLESDLLQCGCLWICAALAAFALDSGAVDDSLLPESRPAGCIAANSISALADLRGLSELCSLGIE